MTVAQAFNIAYEKWQAHKKKKEEKRGSQPQHKLFKSGEEENIQLGKNRSIIFCVQLLIPFLASCMYICMGLKKIQQLARKAVFVAQWLEYEAKNKYSAP